MCCSVYQSVAVCCGVLQCVAVCIRVLRCVAVRCSVLQCVAVRCNMLQCLSVCCGVGRVLQCVAVCSVHIRYCKSQSHSVATWEQTNLHHLQMEPEPGCLQKSRGSGGNGPFFRDLKFQV